MAAVAAPHNTRSQHATAAVTFQPSQHVPLHQQQQQQQQYAAQQTQQQQAQHSSLSNGAPSGMSHHNSVATLPPATAAAAQSTVAPSAAAAASAASAAADSAAAALSARKKPISYAADRVIGTGSFGVVYEAKVVDSGESVAIKKVLQDRRFKNRELQIMSMLHHPTVIGLRHCFYSKGDANAKNSEELYLNLVMDFVNSTLHRTLRDHTKAQRQLPIFLIRLYLWQMLRAVHYIHSLGICHRDIKPQNLLLATKTNTVRLCDFGSAKLLVPGEPNVSYICSRYYRAPELVFEATSYTGAIDTWSTGCVFGEMMRGTPLFPGDSSVDQLYEIIKVLGSPSAADIHAMNPKSTMSFPEIAPAAWSKVFRGVNAPDDALSLLEQFLRYDPRKRLAPLDALAHPFFDPLRLEGCGSAESSGTGKAVALPPTLWLFTAAEIKDMKARGTYARIVPERLRAQVESSADSSEAT